MSFDDETHGETSVYSLPESDSPRRRKSEPDEEDSLFYKPKQWNCGWENMAAGRFWPSSKSVIEKLKLYGIEEFIEEIYGKLDRKWGKPPHKDTFELIIQNLQKYKVPSSYGLKRVDRLLLEIMRLNRFVPTRIYSFPLGYGEKDGFYYEVNETKLEFGYQNFSPPILKEKYPDFDLISHLFHQHSIEVTEQSFENVLKSLPHIDAEIHSSLKDQKITFGDTASIMSLLKKLSSKLKANWHWVAKKERGGESYAHLYIYPRPNSYKQEPYKINNRPNSKCKIWSCGWENIGAVLLDYYDVETISNNLPCVTWREFIESIYEYVDRSWPGTVQAFNIVVQAPTSRPIFSLDRPRDFRRVDEFLLEVMRLHKLVPKKFYQRRLGYGRSGRDYYSIYKTNLYFQPQESKTVISAEDYPNEQVLSRMYSRYSIDTRDRSTERKTFGAIAKELPEVFVEYPPEIKDKVMNLYIYGTHGEILDKMAVQTPHFEWEWRGRQLYRGKEYGKVYFYQKRPVFVPHLSASQVEPDPNLPNWYLGWQNLTCKKLGYRKVTRVNDRIAERGWLDFLEEIHNEIDQQWGENDSVFGLNAYYEYSSAQGNALKKIEDPRDFRRLDQFILEIMRLNGLIPKKVEKQFLGIGQKDVSRWGGSEDQRYNVYATQVSFYPQRDAEVFSKEKYPNYDVIMHLLKMHKIDTCNLIGSPDNEDRDCNSIVTFSQIVAHLRPWVKIMASSLFDNLVMNLNIEGTLCDVINALAQACDAVWDWKDGIYKEGHKVPIIQFKPKENEIPSIKCCDDLS